MNEEFFKIFWSAYPKKVAKEAARKAFRKLDPSAELMNQILTALEIQCEDKNWRKDKGQYIPYPATYLNGRRWEDVGEDSGADTTEPEYGTVY